MGLVDEATSEKADTQDNHRRRLEMVFEHAQDAILLADDDGRYIDANPAACELLVRSREELLSLSVFDITPVPDIETGRRMWREFIATGTMAGEYDLHRKDGRVLSTEFRAVANIQPGVHLSILRDVSARKRAEAERRRFESLAESSADFIGMCTPDRKVLYVNPAGRRMVGLESDAEVFASDPLDYFWPDDQQRIVDEAIPALLRDGRCSIACRFRNFKTGRPIDTTWNAFVIRDPVSGEVVAWATISPDVSATKRAERALAEARDAAQEANAAKDRFLAVLSHELRTPLSPVLMTAVSMEGDADLPEKFRDDIAMIRRNIELETKLIDDLLDLSRVASGKLRLNLAAVSVNQMLRHVLQTCAADLDEKRIRVRCDLHASRDHVDGDAARLQQAFWNLLRNATKFTPDGGEVSVRTSDEPDGRLRIDVIDSGIGIAADLLPRIFDAFEQGDARITRQFGGLGLGLAIAKAVVEMHRGTIAAHSDGANRGTTFTVRLNAVAAPVAATRPTSSSPVPDGSASAPRLLVVDDHEDTANTLARLLKRSGYDVRVATSVAAALELAAAEPFDLVVSDIGLPDGTGYDLMRDIRARHGVQGIALTGYGMEEDLRRSKDVGFVDHVVKPVNLPHLEQVIRRAIGAT
jgi:PAS domain S-box-containing protein